MAASWARFGGKTTAFWLVILALPYFLQISSLWYPTPDASGYLSLARSIAVNHWPTNLGRAQLYYSPGYPLLVSPIFALVDVPFLALSVLNCGLAILFILGVYFWSHRLIPTGAVVITALVVWNVDVMALFRRTLSETFFMPLLIWSVIVLQTGAGQPKTSKGWLMLGSLMTMMLATVRPAGIFVAAGFGLSMLKQAWAGAIPWQRALLKSAAVGAPAVLVLFSLMHYDQEMARQAGANTYLDNLRDKDTALAAQVIEGVRLRVSEFGRLLIPGMFRAYGRNWLDPDLLLYVPLTLVLMVGWWRLARTTGDLLALLFPFYLGLYIVWPYDQATRFFAPMLPLLATCLWFASAPVVPFRRPIFATLATLHLAVALGFWLVLDRPQARRLNDDWPAVYSLSQSIQKDVGPVALISAPADLWLLFQFALDRPVQEVVAGSSIDLKFQWVILPRADTPPPGFHQRLLTVDLQLLRRD